MRAWPSRPTPRQRSSWTPSPPSPSRCAQAERRPDDRSRPRRRTSAPRVPPSAHARSPAGHSRTSIAASPRPRPPSSRPSASLPRTARTSWPPRELATHADTIADQILAELRQDEERRARELRLLEAQLQAAEASYTQAAHFVGTRRRGMGSAARTRLAEARRHLSRRAPSPTRTRRRRSPRPAARTISPRRRTRWPARTSTGYGPGWGGRVRAAACIPCRSRSRQAAAGAAVSGWRAGGGFGGGSVVAAAPSAGAGNRHPGHQPTPELDRCRVGGEPSPVRGGTSGRDGERGYRRRRRGDTRGDRGASGPPRRTVLALEQLPRRAQVAAVTSRPCSPGVRPTADPR